MPRKVPHSVRVVALATVFCALGIAPGCGRETFDLLPNERLVSSGGSASGSAGVSSTGRGGSSGTSGTATGGGGLGGKAGGGGSGGQMAHSGGSSGNAPCLGEAGCADQTPTCSVSSPPLCTSCTENRQCFDTDRCDPELKRCIQCRSNTECQSGQRCNPNTFRCAKACAPGKDSCGTDQHQMCSPDGVCVYCVKETDCNGYSPFGPHCFMNTCVQCFEDKHCASTEVCFYGHCIMH